MKQVRLLLFFFGTLAGFSCERETDTTVVAHDIAFYTLQGQNSDNAPCQLNSARFKEKEKLISSNEILSYHADGHYFTLTAAAINRLKKIKSKIPFYLKVDNKVVYAGFLMPGYLDLTCPGVIVVDPISYSNNVIQVRYDYAGYSVARNQIIRDFRNNETLMKALHEQGKLKK